MATEIIPHGDNIYSIQGFWDKEICDAIIRQAERSGLFPDQETVLIQKTLEDNLDSRDSFKIYLDNQDLSDNIYHYLKTFLQRTNTDAYTHSGVHQNLRVYKYLPGQEFKRHRDGGVESSKDEKSIYSLLIYLNDDFTGGTTLFDSCEIVPTQGMATFFPHDVEHAGTMVTKGIKYVMRGNILFRKNN